MLNKYNELNSGLSQLNGKMGQLTYFDNVYNGENGDTKITMSKSMRADHLYLIFIRQLNGAKGTFKPFAYLLSMRQSEWNYTMLGEEVEVVSKDIKNGRLIINFSKVHWARMVVLELM